jgi:hypothetical protein
LTILEEEKKDLTLMSDEEALKIVHRGIASAEIF